MVDDAYFVDPLKGNSADDWLFIKDAIRAHISTADVTLDDDLLSQSVENRLLFSKFAAAIGATHVHVRYLRQYTM